MKSLRPGESSTRVCTCVKRFKYQQVGLRGSHTQVPATRQTGGVRGQLLGRLEVQGQLLEGFILYIHTHIRLYSLLTGFHSDQLWKNRVRPFVLFVFARCCVSSDPCGKLCAYCAHVCTCPHWECTLSLATDRTGEHGAAAALHLLHDWM